ncbi:MAG TPA: hypothetical protein VFC78_11290 [Tepidisphaeraceae bacterium]|nr:hypothetical protein [Tepidisphaeraceae bacterium]
MTSKTRIWTASSLAILLAFLALQFALDPARAQAAGQQELGQAQVSYGK